MENTPHNVLESPGKSPKMLCLNPEHSTVVEQGLWSVDQSFQSLVNKWEAGHCSSVDSIMPTVDSIMPTVDSIMPTVDSIMPTVDSIMPTVAATQWMLLCAKWLRCTGHFWLWIEAAALKSLLSFRCWILSLRFNGHFPGEPGLAGVYWSNGWWRWCWQLEL